MSTVMRVLHLGRQQDQEASRMLDRFAAPDGTILTDTHTSRRYVRRQGYWLEAPPRRGTETGQLAQLGPRHRKVG